MENSRYFLTEDGASLLSALDTTTHATEGFPKTAKFVVCVTASGLEKFRTMELRSKIHDKMKQKLHKHGGNSGYRKVSYTTVESTLSS